MSRGSAPSPLPGGRTRSIPPRWPRRRTPTDPSRHFSSRFRDILAARELRAVIAHVAAASRARKGVVLLLGGHVVKVGLGPLVARWLERRMVSHVAMNGAAAIHDFELAAFGGTARTWKRDWPTEASGVEETGAEMNAAITAASRDGKGMGEGLADALASRGKLPGDAASILLACRRHRVPVTVHPALGAEIIHQHPSANGAAIGDTGLRDFRRLAGSLPDISDGGAVLNWGSAVMMPEVFLKALSIARNLSGGRPADFLAADFDMIRQYRPRVNAVQRPTKLSGTGYSITGHHELVLPLLVWE